MQNYNNLDNHSHWLQCSVLPTEFNGMCLTYKLVDLCLKFIFSDRKSQHEQLTNWKKKMFDLPAIIGPETQIKCHSNLSNVCGRPLKTVLKMFGFSLNLKTTIISWVNQRVKKTTILDLLIQWYIKIFTCYHNYLKIGHNFSSEFMTAWKDLSVEHTQNSVFLNRIKI